MNVILENLINDFLNDYELDSQGAPTDFEIFCIYTIASREYGRTLEFDDINHLCVDSARGKYLDPDDKNSTSTNDTENETTAGIDGIAIIVNGQLIYTIDQINNLIVQNNYLDVDFIFIQAKSTSSFSTGDILKFGSAVCDFFQPQPKLQQSLSTKELVEISKYLYSKSRYFQKNPCLKMYYITAGNWGEDFQTRAQINKIENDCKQLQFFSSVYFSPIGSEQIQEWFRKTRAPIEAEIVFTNKITLPDINGIKEAYYGILPFSEYKKLLIDENGTIKNIFYDNIRDFLGASTIVNNQIHQTLTSDRVHLFTVLNNGITVVATSLEQTGNKILIKDYQVVNGCQTSYMLLKHIDNIYLDNLGIPIRLISTDDDVIKRKITIATNSQTAIKQSQLLAMTEFQKKLEDFYNAVKYEKLYYERRDKQYHTNPGIKKNQIISIDNQIKSYGSMFLCIPDEVTSFIGNTVQNKIKIDNPLIFNNSHQPIYYYTAALSYYRLMKLFQTRKIDPKYRKIKFFLLMLFGILVIPSEWKPQIHIDEKKNERIFTFPLPYSTRYMKSEKYAKKICEPIIDILNTPFQVEAKINDVIRVVNHSGLDITDKDILKKKNTTEHLIVSFFNI